jgi:hypothetical protein
LLVRWEDSLQRYEEVYQTAGFKDRRYANVDEFVAEYLKI